MTGDVLVVVPGGVVPVENNGITIILYIIFT